MKPQLRWLTEREKSYAVNLGHSSLIWELKENSKNKITVVSSLVMNIERTDKNKKVGRKQFENRSLILLKCVCSGLPRLTSPTV